MADVNPRRLGRYWPILLALGYVTLLAVQVYIGQPTRVGDGDEYMAMSLRMAEGKAPAPLVSELDDLYAQLGALSGGWGIPGEFDRPGLVSDRDTQEFPHFWVYSLLATPFVWIANAVGIHPNYGFAALNVILLSVSATVLLRRTSPAVALLLMASPIVWWVDKAHTEAFTFALLALAFVALIEWPGIAIVLIGLAATQNPPIALLIPVVMGLTFVQQRDLLRTRSFWIAVFAGGFMALLYPVYYLVRLGVWTPQLIVGVVPGIPSLESFTSPVLDLNLGLAVNYPAFLPAIAVAAAAIVWSTRRSAGQRVEVGPLAVSAIGAAVLLFSFTQTTNVNSGGTPGITRYALWLIPLLIPLLTLGLKAWPGFRTALWPIVVGSLVATAAVYGASKPEFFWEPTPAAAFAWSAAPGIENPLVEVFWERTAHADRVPEEYASIGTPDCRKVLVLDGLWPTACGSGPALPASCLAAGDACYANAEDTSFQFVAARRR